jgi:hypothetical protein
VANPVIVDDIEARFGSLTAAERSTAQALIDDAWAVLLTQVPNLETQIEAAAVSPGVVVFVVSSMVLRVLRNPSGIRSWSVDDYTETRDNTLSAGSLYASETEIALLSGVSASTRAFSIKPYEAVAVQRRGSEWGSW